MIPFDLDARHRSTADHSEESGIVPPGRSRGRDDLPGARLNVALIVAGGLGLVLAGR